MDFFLWPLTFCDIRVLTHWTLGRDTGDVKGSKSALILWCRLDESWISFFNSIKFKSTTCTSLSQPRTIKLAAKWWTQLSMSEWKSQVCPSRVAGDQKRAKSQWYCLSNVRLDLVLLPPSGQINQPMQLSFSFSCNSLCSLLLMPLFSHWAVFTVYTHILSDVTWKYSAHYS